MMSIRVLQASSANYYTDLAKENYYTGGGEPPGQWYGGLAEHLNLVNPVVQTTLDFLMTGRHPSTSVSLVQQADRHRAGWDLTASAPKSVSVLWGLSNRTVQKEIEACQNDAVIAAVEWLRQDALYTRRGSGGRRRETVEIVAAMFPHFTNRNQEPQVHTHIVLLNLGLRADGSTGTIETRKLFKWRRTADAIYKAELAAGLQRRLGVSIESEGKGFRIKGVPRELCDRLSTRRAEVLAWMSDRGLTGGKASEQAALRTRTHKTHVAPELLRNRWEQIAVEYRFNARDVVDLSERNDVPEVRGTLLDRESAERRIAATSLDAMQPTPMRGRLSEQVATRIAANKGKAIADQRREAFPKTRSPTTFSSGSTPRVNSDSRSKRGSSGRNETSGRQDDHAFERDSKAVQAARASAANQADRRSCATIGQVIRDTAVWAQSHGVSGREAIRAVRDHFGWFGDAGRPIRPQADERKLRELIHDLKILAGRTTHSLSSSGRAEALSGSRSVDQMRNLSEVWMQITNRGALKLVDSTLGAAPERVIADAYHAWRKSGYKVIVASATPAGRGALEAATKHKCLTVDAILREHRSWTSGERRAARNRVIFGLDTPTTVRITELLNDPPIVRNRPLGRNPVRSNTVVVVHDAHLLQFDQLRQLARSTAIGGGKLVLVGDSYAPQQITGNASFSKLSVEFNAYRIAEPKTPSNTHLQDSLAHLSKRKTTHATWLLLREKRVGFASENKTGVKRVVQQWRRNRTDDLAKSLVLTPDGRTARQVNRQIQQTRSQSGELGRILKQKISGAMVRTGDRVYFSEGSRVAGFRAGEFGTVIGVGLRDSLRVRLDRPLHILGRQIKSSTVINIPASEYAHVHLGYAIPTSDAAGVRVDRVFAVTPKAIPGERNVNAVLYKQLSAAREQAFVTMVVDPSFHVEDFCRQASMDRAGRPLRTVQAEQEASTPRSYPPQPPPPEPPRRPVAPGITR